MDHIVTYQKRNGDILLRPRKSLLGLRIGDETSMGWKVLNIHYLYDGNYYTYNDYCRAFRNKKKPKKRFLKYIIRQLNKLV